MSQAGFIPGNQRYHLWREVLVRQWGGKPYTDDGKTVTYTSQSGIDAFKFYSSLITEHKIGMVDFFIGYGGFRDAFIAGKAGMIIDGSFAIGSISKKAEIQWGVAELPTRGADGEKMNYGSFWIHGLSQRTAGKELEAASKFIKYITSADTMEMWLDKVGELPARRSLANDPALLENPVYGPFVKAVPYSFGTTFVDENAQRKLYYDGLNNVTINNADPEKVLRDMAKEEQKILDEYWK
jgi:multiple sugar transport system substrate-binding protein